MNKELIKKYKKEFDHWLDGGTLLARRWVIDGNDGDTSYTIWYKVDSCSTWMMEDLLTKPQEKLELIIKDDYYIYRKALAEGKIIQQQDYYSKEWIDMKTDKFHGASDTQYEGIYRIKPDEPEFKAGDWVRVTLVHNKSHSFIVKYSNIWDQPEYYTKELWKPQPGEWCWYGYELVQVLDSANPEFIKICRQKSNSYEEINSSQLEPFIGNLPSFLQN